MSDAEARAKAHHPAIVAAVEALERVIEAGVSVIPGSGVLPCLPQSLFKETSAALALLRAAMSNAETAWLMRHNKGGTWPVLMDEDDGDSVRVTVLRWEE